MNDEREIVIHSPFFNDIKVQSGQIKFKRNLADSLTFTLSPGNPGYDFIIPLKTLVKVENFKKQEVVFEGRVLDPDESMNSSGIFSKTFICESELGYLN